MAKSKITVRIDSAAEAKLRLWCAFLKTDQGSTVSACVNGWLDRLVAREDRRDPGFAATFNDALARAYQGPEGDD